jgi:hypothetical protein
MRLWCTRKSLSAPRDHRMADGYSLRSVSVAGTEMTKRVNVWCTSNENCSSFASCPPLPSYCVLDT